MKQLKFKKQDQSVGEVEGILRIDGKICYFKFNNNEYASAMIDKMKAKGAAIVAGRKWIRVNMFVAGEEFILGKEKFNINEKTGDEIEKILLIFFNEKYIQAGFECESSEIGE